MLDEQQLRSHLEGKHLLVTGGTGSFGNQIIDELLPFQPSSIHVYSRDEKKQYDMLGAYKQHSCLKFHIGDIRDLDRTREVMRGIDIVFNAAALKQVPNCETSPYEAVKTNAIGAYNVRQAAIENGVHTVVSISTDKAVKPVNVMGMTKALQERIMLDPSFTGSTRFVCVRYGNVLGSRGSVVPLFCDYILRNAPLPITHPGMTRFQLTLKEAVQLVLQSLIAGESGDVWVRKMPATSVVDLGRVLAYGLTGHSNYPVKILGTRPGEKMHEVLVSEEEMWRATEMDDYFVIPSWAKSVEKVGLVDGDFPEYASDGVHQLSDEELLHMLKIDGWVGDDFQLGPKARRSIGYQVDLQTVAAEKAAASRGRKAA